MKPRDHANSSRCEHPDGKRAAGALRFGAAGQRCMAISRVVLVGKAQEMLPKLVEMASTLTLGRGDVALLLQQRPNQQ